MAPRILAGERRGALVALCNPQRVFQTQCYEIDCACDCGQIIRIRAAAFRRRTACPTCTAAEGAKKRMKHGGSRRDDRDPLYSAYKGMITRCENPKSRNYRWYGAKGVRVCTEWRADFGAFRAWAIANGWARGLTLDRIDSSADYEPGNCVYISQSENSRRMRSAYHFVPRADFEPGITQWL